MGLRMVGIGPGERFGIIRSSAPFVLPAKKEQHGAVPAIVVAGAAGTYAGTREDKCSLILRSPPAPKNSLRNLVEDTPAQVHHCTEI